MKTNKHIEEIKAEYRKSLVQYAQDLSVGVDSLDFAVGAFEQRLKKLIEIEIEQHDKELVERVEKLGGVPKHNKECLHQDDGKYCDCSDFAIGVGYQEACEDILKLITNK